MWLTLAVFIPLCTALILLFIPSREKSAVKIVALVGAILHLLLVTGLVIVYPSSQFPSLQKEMERELNRRINQHLYGHLSQVSAQKEYTFARRSAERKLLVKALMTADWSKVDPLDVPGGEKIVDELQSRGLLASFERMDEDTRELALALKVPLTKNLKFFEYRPWISLFNIRYFLAVDGISLLFIWLTSLLAVLGLIYSWQHGKGLKGYLSMILILETAMVGVFTSWDLFLFLLFWGLALGPIFFLIGIWGGPRRNSTSLKFLIYSLTGTLVLLSGILYAHFQAHPHTFSLVSLTAVIPTLSYEVQKWLFALLLFGIALQLPLFPFHFWLRDVQEQGDTTTGVWVGALFVNLSAYAAIRLLLPLCPEAASTPGWMLLLAGTGLFGLVYGALVATGQTNLRRMAGYFHLSFLGLGALGLASLSLIGLGGAVFHFANHALVAALLLFCLGILERETVTLEIEDHRGLALSSPHFALFLGLAFVAAVAAPGTGSFVSVFSIALGAHHPDSVIYQTGHWWMVYVALVGVGLSAIYFMWTAQRMFFRPQEEADEVELEVRDYLVLAPLATLIVVTGVFPALVTDYLGGTLQGLVDTITPHLSP